MKQDKLLHAESGQTLMETIIAIFILTTALSSGLALMIYAFSSSAVSQNEIIASNLAREGVEVVRAMRDSNWLAADAAGGVWDLQPCADIGNTLCYPSNFTGPTYNLGVGNKRIQFTAATMDMDLENVVGYDLYLRSDGSYSHNNNSSAPLFARMINLTLNTNSPFTASNPEMIVKSIVTWRGKGCTDFVTSDDLAALNTRCKLVVEEHLTNWKDYK